MSLKPIGTIRPYEGNPRRIEHAVPIVAESIRRFGFRQPIVVDGEGVIVVGHVRYFAALEIGMPRVPVHVASDLTPEQAAQYRIADNKTAEAAEWASEALTAELLRLADSSDLDWTKLGFSRADLVRLMGDPPGADPEYVPPVPKKPRTRRGDLWLLGGHRLLCGDSTAEIDVARLLEGGAADLVLTDPPYGVDYVGGTRERMTIANDGRDGLADLLERSLSLTLRHTRKGCVWYVAAPAGPQFADFAAVLGTLGVWRQTLVWVKDAMVLGRSDYHYQHECVFYGWTPGAKHRGPPDRTRTSVLAHERPKRSEEHPTMKPLALWSELMENSSDEGDLVLDPFAGSGTTLVAAERLGRVAACMELSPGYCDVIVQRWEKLTGGRARRGRGGRASA